MSYAENSLTTHDGLRLRTQSWQPEAEPRAVVVLTHGHGEHSGRYGHVGQALSRAGYAVFAYDLRGHGKSGGPRGHMPSYDSMLDDLQRVWDWAGREVPGKKRFLYGHSMGGQITLNYALRRAPQAAGVIVSAPWLILTFRPAAWKVMLGRVMSVIWPAYSETTGLDHAVPMAHDEAHLRSHPDPDLAHSVISAGMGFGMMAGAAQALEQAPQFRYPLLILHGTADGAMDPAGSQQFYERAGSTDKTYKPYPGMYHEVHNETDRAAVLGDVVAWLDERCGD